MSPASVRFSVVTGPSAAGLLPAKPVALAAPARVSSTGAAIDYPDPFFPYLFMILLTANFLGYYAGTLKRCGWLRWTVLLVTLAMFLLWGMRLEAVAARKATSSASTITSASSATCRPQAPGGLHSWATRMSR